MSFLPSLPEAEHKRDQRARDLADATARFREVFQFTPTQTEALLALVRADVEYQYADAMHTMVLQDILESGGT